MPCRNDWDPPTKAQAENRRAAKMLIALNNIQGKTSSTQLLVDSTNPVLDTDYVGVLCERLTFMDRSDRENLLYGDARDRHARDLATWWEEHQARDEARMRTAPTLVGVDTASGPDMTAVSIVPRLQLGQQEYLVPVPRERAAPARPEDMAAFAAELKADPAKAHAFFRAAGIIDQHGGLTPEYGGPAMTDAQMKVATVSDEASQKRAAIAHKRGYEEALNDCIRNGGEAWARSMFADGGEHINPQQAEPVAWRRDAKLQQVRPYYVYRDVPRDGDSREAWEPLYLHPPAAEVQRLRDAATRLVALWNPARPESASVVADAIDKLCRELEGQ